MSSIQVTPAGNQLYEVELHTPDGSLQRHEVTLEDTLAERVAIDDVAMQDVVVAAMEFLTAREGHQELDRVIDLTEVAARYDGFYDQVPARARTLASQPASHPVDDDAPRGDDRLLAEVQREQAEGQATSGRDEL